MDLIEKKDEANFLLREAKKIAKDTGEDGVLSDKQKADIAENRSKAKVLLDKIDAIRETEKLQAEVDEEYTRLSAPQERKVPQSPIDGGFEAKTLEIPSTHPRRYASFKGSGAERNAHKVGLWVRANIFGDPKSGMYNHAAVAEAKSTIRDYFPELRALGTTTTASGGATIPQELAAAIIERREQYGVYEKLANRQTINDQALFPRITSDQMASFSQEGAAIAEADLALDDVSLNPKPLTTISRINNQLINASAVDIAEVVAKDFGRRFAKRIDTVGFNGGIVAADNDVNGGIEGAVQVIEKTTGLAGNIQAANNTFAAVLSANLQSMLGALPEYAAASEPFWICSNAAKELIFGRLQMASGGVTKLETSIGTFDSYSGVPIKTTQLMPKSESAMTTNDVFLLLADLQLGSYLGISEEFEIATSTDRYFERNQTAVRGVMRLDVKNYDFGTTSDAGSIVGLRST